MEDTDFALGLIQKLSFRNSEEAEALGMDFQSRIQGIHIVDESDLVDIELVTPGTEVVMPAQAGIQISNPRLDASLRWHDKEHKGLFLVPDAHAQSEFQYFYADLERGFDSKFRVDAETLRGSADLLEKWEADLVEQSADRSLSAASIMTLSEQGRIKSAKGEDLLFAKSPLKAVLSVADGHELDAVYSVGLRFQTRGYEIQFELNELEKVFSSGIVQARGSLFVLDDPQITSLALDLFFHGPICVHKERFSDFLRQMCQKLGTSQWIFSFQPSSVSTQISKPILYFRASSPVSMNRAKIYLGFRYDNEERMSILHEEPGTKRLPLEFNFAGLRLDIKVRDSSFEKSCEKNLSESFIFNRHKSHWQIARLEGLDTKIWQLIEDGYEVWVEKIKVEVLEHFDFETDAGINWFDAQIKDAFTGEVLNIAELIAYLKKKKTFLRAGSGKLYVLPEKWVQTLASILAKGVPLNDTTMRFSNLWAQDLEAQKAEFAHSNDDPQLSRSAAAFKAARALKPVEQIPGLRCVLRNYQLEGVAWLEFLHSCHCGGILADDMGLGKTVQMIAFLYKKMIVEGNPEKPLVALIVCPKSVVHHWSREIHEFAPELVVTDLNTVLRAKTSGDKMACRPTVILATYGMILHRERKLEELYFDFVVLDEAQLIKNSFSQISRAVKNLKSESRFALTGTPVENRFGELVNIIEFLNPLLRIPYIAKALEGSHSEALSRNMGLLKPLVLRRLKKDLLPELPEKIETTLCLPMDRIQKEMHAHWYHQAELEYKKARKDSAKMPAFLEALMRLRQAALLPSLWVGTQGSEKITSGKLNYLQEKIPELVENNHKIVVFSQFIGFLKAIAAVLERKKIVFSYFDGSTEDREAAIDLFQTNESCPVLLASLKAGGTGISLTSADVCFICDPWWNPAVEQQAMDRLYRMGQTNTVNVFRLVSKDSIEEKMLVLQERKAALMNEVPVADSGFFDMLKSDEFQALFTGEVS